MRERIQEDLQEHGYIYLFVNSTNPNEIKIGKSVSPMERLRQLHNTSTARPMYAYYIWEVKAMTQAEKIAHANLDDRRISKDREFFNVITEDEALFANLEVPVQHGQGHDLVEGYLLTIREILERAWDYWEVDYTLMDLEYMREKHIHKVFVDGKYNSF